MSKAPICPSCSVQMVERRHGTTRVTFFGCPNYPKCTVTFENDAYEDDFLSPES